MPFEMNLQLAISAKLNTIPTANENLWLNLISNASMQWKRAEGLLAAACLVDFDI